VQKAWRILPWFRRRSAAVLAAENILSVEVVAFEELGMEAVRKIVVKNMPAFILTDDKGNDFFDQYNKRQ